MYHRNISIVAEHRNGSTMAELARKYNITPPRIKQIILKATKCPLVLHPDYRGAWSNYKLTFRRLEDLA